MAQYSPDLIQKTITIFGNRTTREISREEARQAVENISGFFRVLQEWAAKEAKEGYENDSSRPAGLGGGLE